MRRLRGIKTIMI